MFQLVYGATVIKVKVNSLNCSSIGRLGFKNHFYLEREFSGVLCCNFGLPLMVLISDNISYFLVIVIRNKHLNNINNINKLC